MDLTDRQILNILLEDGDAKYKKIAKKLKTTVGTVHNRIKKMRKDKILKTMMPILDHKKLGYDVSVVIHARIRGGHLQEVQEKYVKDKNVCGIYDVAGDADTIFIAKFKNTAKLNVFVKKLMAEEFVERTNTSLVLDIVKETLVPYPLE